MGAIVVRRPGGGEARLLGLFTSRAYSEPASATPLLHRKLERILEAEDLIEGSHDYKAAVHLFDSFPMDELFASTVEEVRVAVSALLTIQGDEVRLLGRRSRDGTSAALIAALPRSRYSASLRERLRDAMVEAFAGARVDVHEVLQESDRVQVHFAVHDAQGLPEVDVGALEARIQGLARTWADLVCDVLVAGHGDERGRMLAARWVKRLPESYRAATPPALAAEDLLCLEALTAGSEDFYVGLLDEADRTRVTMYKRGPKVELSRATPMLEDMGLRVIEEIP